MSSIAQTALFSIFAELAIVGLSSIIHNAVVPMDKQILMEFASVAKWIFANTAVLSISAKAAQKVLFFKEINALALPLKQLACYQAFVSLAVLQIAFDATMIIFAACGAVLYNLRQIQA